MKPTVVKTPKGEELVLLPRADYEALRAAAARGVEAAEDAQAHQKTLASLARGEQETLTPGEVEAALAAPTPLAFWRKKRGLTQRALAEKIGFSQSYVADLEAGRRQGDAGLVKKLATALRLRMEDLVVDRE